MERKLSFQRIRFNPEEHKFGKSIYYKNFFRNLTNISKTLFAIIFIFIKPKLNPQKKFFE
jgi:hypothetical protein